MIPFALFFLSLIIHWVDAVTRTDIVILGAGATGISAAATLTEQGEKDFILVDGQSFIGGRVQHAFLDGHTVELGANWIYGKGTNPIYKLATRHGLRTAPNDKDNVVFFSDQGPIPLESGREVYDEFDQVMKEMVMYAERRMARKQTDLASRSALQLLGWEPNTALKAAVEYFAIDWELAEPPEVASLDYATGTSDMTVGSFPYGNEFVVDPRGFNYILKQEANRFLEPNDTRLWLDTVVTEVLYSDKNVTVITNHGQVIVADYAICTFSLGVLQSDTVQFVPPFPEWKREALISFHMTTYTKIFVLFDRPFWEDWQFALYAPNRTHHQDGYYTVWQNLNAPGYLDAPVLMVTTTFKESERIEKMTDQEVQEEVTQVIRQMFAPLDIPKPKAILFPRWHSHPLFRGSYSNWPIGMLSQHHDNMRAALPADGQPPRLWFAGEATSTDYYGYLHGAWLEGQAAANNILKCQRSDACPSQPFYEFVTGCDRTTFKFRRQDAVNP